MTNTQHLPLYLKLCQLNKHINGVVRQFPKHYKYTLGKDIIELNWRCLDFVIEANTLSGEKKLAKILALSITFDKLKIRIRMAQELDLLSEKQFVHMQSYYLKEIGDMVGGWLNWACRIKATDNVK